MERILLSKIPGMVRASEFDHRNKGVFYKGYVYKDLIPVTYGIIDDESVSIDISIERVLPYDDLDAHITDTVNSYMIMDRNKWDSEKFTDFIEECYQYAVETLEERGELETAKERIDKWRNVLGMWL